MTRGDLLDAIQRVIDRHVACLEQRGAEHVEDRLDDHDELRWRMKRQRAHVAATLEGDPEEHVAHLEALLRGIDKVEERL